MTIISGVLPVMTFQFTQIIFNTLHRGQKSTSDLIGLVIIYVIFLIFTSILSNMLSFFSNKLATKINYVMTEQLMERCSLLTLEELEDSETYEKITRIQNEIRIKPILAIFFLLYSIFQIILNLKIAHQEFEMMYNRSEKERKIWYYTFLLSHDTGFKKIKVLNLKDYFLGKY